LNWRIPFAFALPHGAHRSSVLVNGGREGWGGHMTQSLWDIIERFVFDPSFVDLVVWFPHLSWHEFAASTATVVVYKFISQQIEKIATFHARRLVAFWLLRLALMVRPS
jgi:hypothetical protein